MDSIVHPALTFQMVDALIKANKDFDLLILPNRVHQHYRDVYFLRRKWDYLMMHLRSETPPQGYQIQPPPPQV
jgi:dipeptidyl aminopeptidase/acylaminoacyl peptidase